MSDMPESRRARRDPTRRRGRASRPTATPTTDATQTHQAATQTRQASKADNASNASNASKASIAGTARRTTTVVVQAIVLIVIAAVAWVGIRGYLAARDLQASEAMVTTLKSQLGSADSSGADATAAALRKRAGDAAAKTSDPVWRAAEYVPLVGGNLRAVRQIAGIIDDVADNGVQPATTALRTIDLAGFKPVDGKVDLQPLVAAKPSVDKVTATLNRALADSRAIDTSSAVSAVDDAADRLTNTLQSVAAEAQTADRFVDVAPGMLGADGPRNYLLLFENNAELRAGGGIPSALALVHTDGGALSLTQQASSQDFPRTTASALPLTTDTRGLYGDITGQYIQDVTLTPRFELSARLARQMWANQYGTQVDGVLALDPVTLGYVLQSTGPVTLPTGDVLTSDNVVKLLLSDVYARYPDPAVQDQFFAGAASAVFGKVASGGVDPKQLIAALTKGVDERRVQLWSAHDDEQRVIAPTELAGDLPQATSEAATFGVYLNDGTGAKMDYYLDKQVAIGGAVCRADGRPTWTVEVTLKNTAPANAGSTLPEYVTGGGAFGVPPGDVRTNVIVYVPASGTYLSTAQDGKLATPLTALDGRRFVVTLPAQLAPGQSTTVRVQVVGPRSAASTPVSVRETAGVVMHEPQPVAETCS